MTDEPFEQLLKDADAALAAFKDEAVEIVREGLRSAYPPSSKPGERPHRRTGQLERSIDATVERDGDFVRLNLTASAPYAGYLESSGRDIFGNTDDLVDRAAQRLEQRLNANG